MFTGVGKLKISLPECGFEWRRKSMFVCVLLSVFLCDLKKEKKRKKNSASAPSHHLAPALQLQFERNQHMSKLQLCVDIKNK